jgi:hypothetical protein
VNRALTDIGPLTGTAHVSDVAEQLVTDQPPNTLPNCGTAVRLALLPGTALVRQPADAATPFVIRQLIPSAAVTRPSPVPTPVTVTLTRVPLNVAVMVRGVVIGTTHGPVPVHVGSDQDSNVLFAAGVAVSVTFVSNATCAEQPVAPTFVPVTVQLMIPDGEELATFPSPFPPPAIVSAMSVRVNVTVT